MLLALPYNPGIQSRKPWMVCTWVKTILVVYWEYLAPNHQLNFGPVYYWGFSGAPGHFPWLSLHPNKDWPLCNSSTVTYHVPGTFSVLKLPSVMNNLMTPQRECQALLTPHDTRAGEMVQWYWLSALPKDWGLISSFHVRLLMATSSLCSH